MKICTLLLLAVLPFGNEGDYMEEIRSSVSELHASFEPVSVRDCAVLSIGAPELLRYSILSDFLETEILEIAYTRHGNEMADFSIGKFQMKPSFVERLEQEICQQPSLSKAYSQLVTYHQENEKSVRAERIRRIKSEEFQWLILQAFYDYCHIVYCGYLEGLPPEKTIGFIGTAYNMGFGYTVQQIVHYMTQQNFPYGSRYEGEQYAYSQLSLKFFKQLIKSLCKNSQSSSLQECSSGLARNYP